MTVAAILKAMKATSIPDGRSGLWKIESIDFTPNLCAAAKRLNGRIIAPGLAKFLRRYTASTLMNDGECVMEDTDPELRKHLQFILTAKGRVLVTGLGLGCVVRGLLTRPAVTSIDAVEISPNVLEMVEPHMPVDPRLTIHRDDAVKFIKRRRADRWDCAWHDVWTDIDNGEPHLDVLHAKMMIRLRGRVAVQGAWALDRRVRRELDRAGVRQI